MVGAVVQGSAATTDSHLASLFGSEWVAANIGVLNGEDAKEAIIARAKELRVADPRVEEPWL